MNLLTNDSIINLNETKRIEEENIKRKGKQTHNLDFNVPRSFSPHTHCFMNHQTSFPIRISYIVPVL